MTDRAQDWTKPAHRRQFRADAEAAAAKAMLLRIHPEVLLALLDALDAAEAGVRGLADYVRFERRLTAMEAAEEARVRGLPRPRQADRAPHAHIHITDLDDRVLTLEAAEQARQGDGR